MTTTSARASRRQLVGAAAGIAAVVTGHSPLLSGAAMQESTPETQLGTVQPPDWFFTAESLHDPYTGVMQAPQTPPDGTRYVATVVEITNESDQPLNFTPLDVRLRDDAGNEYRGGGAIGSEPSINPRNLNAGERSRGWIWFAVAAQAVITEIVYVAPSAQLRLRLV